MCILFQYVETSIFPIHRPDGLLVMEKDADMKELWMIPIFILNYTGCSKSMESRYVSDVWMNGELTSRLRCMRWKNELDYHLRGTSLHRSDGNYSLPRVQGGRRMMRCYCTRCGRSFTSTASTPRCRCGKSIGRRHRSVPLEHASCKREYS